MPQVDLIHLLSEIDDYILIKKSDEFPNYNPGSDVDILVMDKNFAINKTIEYYESSFVELLELRVSDNEFHSHIDFLFNGEIDIRIDLIDNFDFYTKFSVKNSFFIKLFKDSQTIHIDDFSLKVPSAEDDLTIRYFEYLEYYDRYYNKIKHLDYICDVDDEIIKKRFFENTHKYISFRHSKWKGSIDINEKPISRRKAIMNIRNNFKYLIKTTLKYWIS